MGRPFFLILKRKNTQLPFECRRLVRTSGKVKGSPPSGLSQTLHADTVWHLLQVCCHVFIHIQSLAASDRFVAERRSLFGLAPSLRGRAFWTRLVRGGVGVAR